MNVYRYIALHANNFSRLCCTTDDCKYMMSRMFAQNKLNCSCPPRCTYVCRHSHVYVARTQVNGLFPGKSVIAM